MESIKNFSTVSIFRKVDKRGFKYLDAAGLWDFMATEAGAEQKL